MVPEFNAWFSDGMCKGVMNKSLPCAQQRDDLVQSLQHDSPQFGRDGGVLNDTLEPKRNTAASINFRIFVPLEANP